MVVARLAALLQSELGSDPNYQMLVPFYGKEPVSSRLLIMILLHCMLETVQIFKDKYDSYANNTQAMLHWVGGGGKYFQ
jgi:hypothetical protein